MEQRYKQISSEERCEISRLQTLGNSIRQIASALDRSPSTISREIKRNSGSTGNYQPIYANQQSRSRRWSGSILDRNSELRERVLFCLRLGWSPEQVSERFKVDYGTNILSYETIYRFIYAQIARTKDYSWRYYLPRKKSKRGWRGRKGGGSDTFIAHRRPLSERPKDVDKRLTVGHWEADLMLFSKYGQAVLTLHERYTRLLVAVKLPNKSAQLVALTLKRILEKFPPEIRQTVTFDNGTEFARHYELHHLNIETFFCDKYSPWQKGGIENAIGRMRRMLPRKTDIVKLPQKEFDNIVIAYNNTPRKCLDYQTPAAMFWSKMLHFKCECTFLPSQE